MDAGPDPRPASKPDPGGGRGGAHDPRDAVAMLFDALADQGRAEELESAHGTAAARIVDLLALAPADRVLEIGCGNGHALVRAAERVPRGRVTGIDASAGMVARARDRCGDAANIRVLHVTLEAAALEPGSFDAAFALDALAYVADLPRALRIVRDALAPGGRFACAVDFYAENTASHRWPRDLGVPMKLHSALGWKRLFAAEGFEVLDQGRVKSAGGLDTSPWRARQGMLYTLGRRPESPS